MNIDFNLFNYKKVPNEEKRKKALNMDKNIWQFYALKQFKKDTNKQMYDMGKMLFMHIVMFIKCGSGSHWKTAKENNYDIPKIKQAMYQQCKTMLDTQCYHGTADNDIYVYSIYSTYKDNGVPKKYYHIFFELKDYILIINAGHDTDAFDKLTLASMYVDVYDKNANKYVSDHYISPSYITVNGGRWNIIENIFKVFEYGSLSKNNIESLAKLEKEHPKIFKSMYRSQSDYICQTQIDITGFINYFKKGKLNER